MHNQLITPQTIRLRRLKRKLPLLWEVQNRVPIRIRRNPINQRPLHRRSRHPIHHPHRLTLPLLNRNLRRAHHQEMLKIKRIIRPQDLIPGRDFLLTAADGGELEVFQQSPELGGGLGVRADRGDEEVVELGVEGAVEGEIFLLRGGGEGGGAGVGGGGVGGVVGAVAEVGAAGGGGDVAGAGVNGAFVDGGGGAFDAEVYGVGSGEEVVSMWYCGCWRSWCTYSDLTAWETGTGAGLGTAWVREMRRVVVVRKLVKDSIVNSKRRMTGLFNRCRSRR